MNLDNFSEWLDEAAQRVGAHAAACIRLDNPALRQRIKENSEAVADWLESGQQGEMDYLERMLPEKSNPWKTFPFAQSVIVLTFSNHWGDPAATHPFPKPGKDALVGYISAYAREADYHTAGQAMLAELKGLMGEGFQSEAVVDTAPVFERIFAAVGGLGQQGGNGLLRTPQVENTRAFIGCLFVDTELPEVILDPVLPFACDTCRACIQHCPTGAIQFAQPIDARKCITYLTVEKRSVLSAEEGASIGDWLFGCDHCTTACPDSQQEDARIPVDLEWLLKSSAGELRRTLKGNATAYAGVTQLRKNAVVVLKNMNTPRADELLQWVRKNSGSDLVLRQVKSM